MDEHHIRTAKVDNSGYKFRQILIIYKYLFSFQAGYPILVRCLIMLSLFFFLYVQLIKINRCHR